METVRIILDKVDLKSIHKDLDNDVIVPRIVKDIPKIFTHFLGHANKQAKLAFIEFDFAIYETGSTKNLYINVQLKDAAYSFRETAFLDLAKLPNYPKPLDTLISQVISCLDRLIVEMLMRGAFAPSA